MDSFGGVFKNRIMNRIIKIKLKRDGEELQTDKLRLDVNGIRYTMNIEPDGRLRINKYDDTETGDDSLCIKPHFGNVIDIF